MNKNIRNIIIAVVITCFINTAVCVLYFNFFKTENISYSSTSIDSKLDEITQYIEKNAIMPFDEETAKKNAVYFYVASIEDKYCSYFDKDDYGDYMYEMAGSFTGIGINVMTKSQTLENGLFIYRVIGNSPAEKAGIMNGDIIIEADGTSFVGYDYNEAVDILLGEEGTTVNIKIDRNGEELQFNVLRQSFTKQLVKYEIIGEIGYVIIYEFDEAALSQFQNALKALEASNVKGYIFDVRNNPGGELNTVKNIVDALVPKDELVVLQYKDSELSIYSSDNRIVEDKPMAVLLNGDSASAAELFSSALRDILNVPLVGEQSYGKGVGQTTFTLSDGSAIKFTTFRYVTKSRYNYDGIGLEPDYVVEAPEEWDMMFYTVSHEDDIQLQKAIQVVSEQLE